MKKLFVVAFLFSVSAAVYSQTGDARMRSDEMSQPEIDNLSGAKPDGDDLSPQSTATSYSTGGFGGLVMDKPEDDGTTIEAVKGNIQQLQQVDLTTATIYPNPATDYINVTTEATTGYIRVLNLLGQEMLMVNINAKENYINISNLNEGIYFVSIESGDQKVVKKIKVLN